MNDVKLIKLSLSPTLFYQRHLTGGFGEVTGKGWYAWNGLCPFHADKKPGSLFVNKRTGAFKCFACGAHGGDIIDFHVQHNHVGFSEAVKQLWEEIGCVK